MRLEPPRTQARFGRVAAPHARNARSARASSTPGPPSVNDGCSTPNPKMRATAWGRYGELCIATPMR